MWLTVALALLAALPYPKTGQCASGYTQSGGYCVPMNDNSKQAVPKIPGQQCPSGYSTEANSCVKMR